ncbi:1-acyl-sn-glycerol-3-phosphate acyltransferase [Thiohalomonas denitrificans]|uniref:1-acyl-sn-glycerol-3-phosphate acyltransferase n=2 Tax=Thiohalomonas denitrificans TaxID=415747 RepID=A0A1G5PLG9_9GAMM|nr:1-acyl-sn-glycerol-3-phosphate acyltransferase [Thiohalomonas denitrificans]
MPEGVSQVVRPDWGARWLNAIDRLNSAFCRGYHRMQADPVPLPAEGPALVVANHLSGLDPLVMIAASPRPLRFLIAKEEYERLGLRALFKAVGCIPVDRAGRPERAFREAVKALQSGEVVALFPEGGIHTGDKRPPLKRGVWKLAQLAGCPIYPLHIEGIAGEGRIVSALLRRSRIRVFAHPPITCSGDASTCLDAVYESIGMAPDPLSAIAATL